MTSNYPDDIMRTIHDPANPLNEDEPDCEHEDIAITNVSKYNSYTTIYVKCKKCDARAEQEIELNDLEWEETE